MASAALEVRGELIIPIANEESRSLCERCGIAELLRRPRAGGRTCNGPVHDFASAEIDDEESEYGPEPDVVGLDEVARPDVLGVVLEEGCPALTGAVRLPTRLQIPLDRALRNTDTELEQFTANALRDPEAISRAMR